MGVRWKCGCWHLSLDLLEKYRALFMAGYGSIGTVGMKWRKRAKTLCADYILFVHASVLCASVVWCVLCVALKRWNERNKLDANKLMDYVLVGKQFIISIWSILQKACSDAQYSTDVIQLFKFKCRMKISFVIVATDINPYSRVAHINCAVWIWNKKKKNV